MKTLLTGASGFVGSRLMATFPNSEKLSSVSLQTTSPAEIDFSEVKTIIHCAGIAHRMEPTPDELYFSVNRDLTLELARAAKAAGVGQFIFLSTIKVYGVDAVSTPLTADSVCEPDEPYGASKLAAEEGLQELEDDSFRVAIIRPPLIYGPGAKGNLQRLMELVCGNKPIPLGGIHNRRSMVFLDNLIHLIHCIRGTTASGIFLPSDRPVISTSQLVQQLIAELNPGKKMLALPGPLRWGIKLLKPEFHKRLFGSLEVQTEPEIWAKIGYQQPHTVEEGIRTMAKAFQR